MTEPRLRILSLGAGVQSTTLLLLAAEGRVGPLDAAIFADTGWEPRAVYDHLDRIEREVAQPAGIPIHRVSVGNIRDDALNPGHHFASMPLYVKGPNGERGIARRQCTSEYKVRPIKTQVRAMLGYPHPRPVPRGVYVEQWIGISRDEFQRAKDSQIGYAVNVFPLLDLDGTADGRLGWTRGDCVRYLTSRGYGATPKSACVGCPFRRNRSWRKMRDERPDEFADAIAFDNAIRAGSARATAAGQPLRGQMFLHAARVPLDVAPIDHVTHAEWGARQTDLLDAIADEDLPEFTCSPFTCPADEEDWRGAA